MVSRRHERDLGEIGGEPDVGQQSEGMLRVLLDVLIFFIGEFGRLEQHIVADPYLSVIVEQARVINDSRIGIVQPDRPRDACCHGCNPGRMARSAFVSGVQRQRKGQDETLDRPPLLVEQVEVLHRQSGLPSDRGEKLE